MSKFNDSLTFLLFLEGLCAGFFIFENEISLGHFLFEISFFLDDSFGQGSLFFQDIFTEFLDFLVFEHSIVNIGLFGFSHSLIKVGLLNVSDEISALFSELFLVVGPLNSLELAGKRIQLDLCLKLFLLYKTGLLQNPIKGLLPGLFIQPLIL